MKTCTKCGIEKPLTEFYKSKTHKGGHRSDCKICNRQKYSRWYSKNKEKKAKYHAKNKEKMDKYYAQNKNKFKQYSAKRYVNRKIREPAFVYELRNCKNNKAYIGETTRGKIRWKEHIKKLRGGYHENYQLQQDFDEHGEEAFEWSIIKDLPKNKDQLLLEEAREIQRRINNGEELYNLMLTIEQLKMLNENQEVK
jgi:predicted GIY-YIG superfamily endonuclease